MRRADRLFRLVQLLRGGRLWTAARLAEASEVSARTIYRDIADLQGSGVPVEGEAGVGYVMRAGFDLPPLMFTADEVTALALGARMVAAWGGMRMTGDARAALSKIEAVLPRPQQVGAALDRLGAPATGLDAGARARIDALDAAVRDRRVVRLRYRDEGGAASDRLVRPLGLWFWGRVWTLVAWCELRGDFRMFRIDRMAGCSVLDEGFPSDPERSLRACIAAMEAREGCRLPLDTLAYSGLRFT